MSAVICLKTFRDERRVCLLTVVPQAEPGWSFDQVKDGIINRFGDQLPPFVMKAWLTQSQEPYAFGCVHNIQYRTVRPKYWNRPYPFPMDMNPKSSVIGRRVKDGGTDPCMWMDLKYRITFQHILRRRGSPLTIHTRSDLIAHDEYLDALDSAYHKVCIYLTDATDEAVRMLEPGAPSNSRRRQAIERLKSRGITVDVVHITPSQGGAV